MTVNPAITALAGLAPCEEVGDPDGDGVPTPGTQVTHPGDANSKPEPPSLEIPSAEDVGLNRIVPDKIVFETDLDNPDNWKAVYIRCGYAYVFD